MRGNKEVYYVRTRKLENDSPSEKTERGYLQYVYKLHLTEKKSFITVDYFLKNLYRSYNFAAAVISEAVKKKIPINEVGQLDECLETMIDCCDEIIKRLNKRK